MTILERMALAVEELRDRLLRATRALEEGEVKYAVVGGNAVAAWVARVNAGAVRNTRDVDIMVSRADLSRASEALQKAGFVHRRLGDLEIFLEPHQATGTEHKGRRVDEAVHLLFAEERVRADSLLPSPSLDNAERLDQFVVIPLEGLVHMKLTSFRDKDRVHLRDLIGVGLVDEDWPERLPAELGARLQHVLDTPDG
jgi:hypothetical protein